MYSFQVNVGSRGYHVYKDTEWKPITVSKLINLMSIWHYPHCCGIMIQGRDKFGPIVKVRFMFLQVSGVTSGTGVDTKHKQSTIPEGEIPCLLNFTHPCKEILDKMKRFVENIKMMKKKLEKIMNLQNNHLTNSLTKSIINLTTKKKKKYSFLKIYFFTSYYLGVSLNFNFFSCFFQLGVDSIPTWRKDQISSWRN